MATRTRTRPAKETRASRSGYDRLKEYDGQKYTGMKVGRRHKWRYDAGEWTEKKVTPDRWDFQYSVVKRRAGRAPEGSGAPVGTAYRWYILANQIVTKVDANSYTTEMAGLKYKVAHKRADKSSWNASDSAQRRRLVKLLREMITELEQTPASAAPQAEPKPGTAKRRSAKPSTAKRRSAKPSTAKPRRAKPRIAKPARRRRPLAA
jgi:hypothetical protein